MDNQDHRFVLEDRKVTQRRKLKYTCPACGRRKCFTRYIDLKRGGAYVDETCGKCDHLNHCGYHLTPKEYYAQNPSELHREELFIPIRKPQMVYMPLSPDLVVKSHSAESIFWQWLSCEGARRLNIPAKELRRVYDAYMIGATTNHEVIFWQIDVQGQVRAGHIMQFLPDGHRDHQYQSWVHYRMQKQGLLPPNYELRQCLFGEHLLMSRPEASVCVVESEKSAVILAAMYPEQVWLATNGCHGLNAEKLSVLRGRHASLFPDSGSTEKWMRVVKSSDIPMTINTNIEKYEPNTDLVDVFMGEAKLRPPSDK